MAAPTRPKKALEAIVSLKTTGASAPEAVTAAQFCHQVADDAETMPELRALMTTLERELAAPPSLESAARRENILARLNAAVGRFI